MDLTSYVLERQGEPQKPIDQLPSRPSSSGGRPSLDILDVEHVAHEPARDRMPAATRRLLRAIDNEMSPETGAWMTGYARITANLQDQPKRTESAIRYIVATPLYVEYSTSQTDSRLVGYPIWFLLGRTGYSHSVTT
jgi:hypothetical protein